MKYTQLNTEERYVISTLRTFRFSQAAIARCILRSPSTVSRELRRNAHPTDGGYRAQHACSMANGRRRRSRQGSTVGAEVWARVEQLLREDYSPEQVTGHLRRLREASVSHETIYRYVWQDKKEGGDLHTRLRGSPKKRRKRYGAYDSRGRLAGKRPIAERPPGAENRSRLGHWEIDTVLGSGRACILTLVDRKTGYVQIGKLAARTIEETNGRLKSLMARDSERYRTITSDNGCEFHGYKDVESGHRVKFYFAAPHHSWERGTNENTNGLIRQYLPKRTSMDDLTQAECDRIANKLNARPRKRYGYRTPAELYHKTTSVALRS
jgi:IS30 family transposase